MVRFEHDSRERSFGVEAVDALTTAGIAAGQIYKTLIIAVPGGFAVAILPAPSKLSLKAAAAALGVGKASMAEPAAAQRATGYVLGAVSPFGQRMPLSTVVDSGALAWDRVYCSAGRRGWDVAVAPRGSGPAHRRGHRGDSGLGRRFEIRDDKPISEIELRLVEKIGVAICPRARGEVGLEPRQPFSQ